MAHYHHGSRNQARDEHQLWFDMPHSSQRHHEQSHAGEQSAYRSTTNRLSTGSTSSTSSRLHYGIPTIATISDTNKPLPPAPHSAEKKKRRSGGLRSILGRPSTNHLDPAHLQPQQYGSNHRYSATTTNLSINTEGQYHHGYSRSMPNSPYEHLHVSSSSDTAAATRAHSSAANHGPDTFNYPSYDFATSHNLTLDPTNPVYPARTSSMHTYFDTTPPRSRTFPTESPSSSTLREGLSNRPRPHTWLSPTESFSDPSQFSLFAQATTGLPHDMDPFSPNGPPQLQGSLFARRSANDTIPIPLQSTVAAAPSVRYQRTDWQNFEPPAFSSRSVSAPMSTPPRTDYEHYQSPPHIHEINRELEILGLDDDTRLDDELPDYAQSQAEAHARRRQEASARARELESRWRSTRG